MAEDSDLERTEPASQRRLEKAREEGNVPQSRELGTFIMMMAGAVSLSVLGGWCYPRMVQIARRGWMLERHQVFDTRSMSTALMSQFGDALTLLAPFFLVMVIAAVAGPMLIGGFNLSTKSLGFNASRLNPMEGVKRIISVYGLVELVKALLKTLVVGGVAGWVVYGHSAQSLSLIGMSVETGSQSFVSLVLGALIWMAAGLALIAGIDVPFQLWHYYDRLRMTKEELRQELKEQEGDPQVKGRIRARQREMARRRMMEEVPKADVVVTNPTHYAVALKYDGTRMRAPRVVAKGADLVAGQIRELARANQVPLLEAPPLARALFRHTELGDDVPAALYTAVAEVMAWVFTLRDVAAHGGTPPPEPAFLPVPPELDPANTPAPQAG